MFSIIGIVVVFGAIVCGYLMEKGNLAVLLQPAELVIIFGAAVGTVLIGNPPYTLKAVLAGVAGVFRGSSYTRKRYLESLKMLYDLFTIARRGGLVAIEADIEEPSKSKVFTRLSLRHEGPPRGQLHMRYAADDFGGSRRSLR